MPLNESPSEKEGKCREAERTMGEVFGPSMKVPPKRKGNNHERKRNRNIRHPSMKVPPKRKGNIPAADRRAIFSSRPQ